MTERNLRPTIDDQTSILGRLLGDSSLDIQTARGPHHEEPKNKT
jgi:hypothetical protein